MRTVWHVYIDEEEADDIPLYPGSSKLPFDTLFCNMKLFATKKGAEKYISSELEKLGKYLECYGVLKYPQLEATDGGEIRSGLVVYDKRNKPVKCVWFKAVRRTVRP